jgi:peptidylprolyl isomerase
MKSNWWRNLLRTTLVGVLLLSLSVGLSAGLAQGDAITDPNAILRYALPIENDTVRKLQASLEELASYLRSKRWTPIAQNVKTASRILNVSQEKLLATVPTERQEQGKNLLAQMTEEVETLKEAVEAKDKEQIWNVRKQILDQVGEFEELMVTGFPFEVPDEYSNLPQLLGRATVELETTKGNLTIAVDGYSAPVNAGNFVDLVQRGFYNGLPISRAEDNYIVQTGKPVSSEEGFIDPKIKQYRAIPLEVLVKGEAKPIYGMTLEEAGVYLADLALPFNSYGTVALARPENNPNGGSSQFFFFKFDNEIAPPGFNLMDGRYSAFGYLIDGKNVLDQLTTDDKIISAKVVSGLNNLVQPS